MHGQVNVKSRIKYQSQKSSIVTSTNQASICNRRLYVFLYAALLLTTHTRKIYLVRSTAKQVDKTTSLTLVEGNFLFYLV